MLTVNIQQFSYPATSEIVVLEAVSFSLQKGEHLAILGESGCGKSTLLHLIYGLLHLEKGSITWNKKQLLGPNHKLVPGESFIKLVAQEFNLMPFISVHENIASHLSRKNQSKDNKRVEELLAVVDLAPYKDTKVKNLSGGQKQRVALAKALANEPEIILLDEPFSNIDTSRKSKLRRQLFRYLKEKQITCITATHESDEALGFADTICMLQKGTVVNYGSPKEVFSNLSGLYQASFFGAASQLESALFFKDQSSKTITVLPHQLNISENKTAVQAIIKHCYFKGHYYEIEALFGNTTLFLNHYQEITTGKKVYISLEENFRKQLNNIQ